MTAPVFGLQFIRQDDEPRPVIGADLSTAGIIGPAADADAVAFPLDTPVKVYSNDTATLAKLGEAGYLADAIRGINDQLGENQVAARIVVVRVAEGSDPDPALKTQKTIAKIMGSSSAGTGLWAFVKSANLLACTPRLICAPGYTSQQANSVGELSVDVEGAGYTPGQTYALTFSGGGVEGIVVQATGHAVANADGEITQNDVFIDTYGAWYTDNSAPTVAIDPPEATDGTQCEITCTASLGANPVVASLPAILDKLVAHAVVESAGVSEQDDQNWRETINCDRIIPFTGGVKILDPVSALTVTRPRAAREIGIIIKRDNDTGAPFHSAANQPMAGIIGPARDIAFSLTDGDNEGQQLLAGNIGIMVRGELGVENAISSGGFISIATDNAGDDELWRFYNQMRGRDYIHLSLMPSLRTFLGRQNITSHSVTMILNTIKFFLRDLQAEGHILGSKVGFTGVTNSPEEIRLGHLTVSFAAEEPPVLRRITTLSMRFRPAIDAMVASLERQLSLAA